jgi:hypothetical protein
VNKFFDRWVCHNLSVFEAKFLGIMVSFVFLEEQRHHWAHLERLSVSFLARVPCWHIDTDIHPLLVSYSLRGMIYVAQTTYKWPQIDVVDHPIVSRTALDRHVRFAFLFV